MAKLDISITAMEPEEIKNDLIAQLKAKGADVAVFEDLIDRYLFYRDGQEIRQGQPVRQGCGHV